MSDWQSKSDFEINTAVTSFVHGCEKWALNDAEFYHCGIDGSGYYSQPIVDYCNDASYAWPIILSDRISVAHHNDDEWMASKAVSLNSFCALIDKKPLRAAMIVYLEINGVKP